MDTFLQERGNRHNQNHLLLMYLFVRRLRNIFNVKFKYKVCMMEFCRLPKWEKQTTSCGLIAILLYTLVWGFVKAEGIHFWWYFSFLFKANCWGGIFSLRLRVEETGYWVRDASVSTLLLSTIIYSCVSVIVAIYKQNEKVFGATWVFHCFILSPCKTCIFVL